jgi:hypothetical protein
VNKFALAIMPVASLLLISSSSFVVHAQLSSQGPSSPALFMGDSMLSRQTEQPAIMPNTSARTFALQGLENSSETVISFLEENEKRARNELNGNVKNMFLTDTAHLESFIKRFTRLVAALEYGVTYQAAKNASKYTFVNATIQDGVQSVVVRMFPRTAPLLTEHVVTISSSTLINITTFLDSSEFKADEPRKVIKDKSGRFSLDEKRQALYQEWTGFDQNGFARDRMVRNLVDDTEIVYRQSVQAPVR